MTDDPKRLVPVKLVVQQWQLDYSRRMMTQGHVSETDFLQAVLNTALLRHIPQEAWPPMSDAERKAIKDAISRGEADSDIPF